MKKATIRKQAQRAVALTSCQDCGSVENLQRHHSDYNKPKDVQILCSKCHRIRDINAGVQPRIPLATCVICHIEFQPKKSRRKTLCGSPECLREQGRLAAAKRWKTNTSK